MTGQIHRSDAQSGFAAPTNAPAVLHLDTPYLELAWVRKGEVLYASRKVSQEGGLDELVAAARELIQEAKLGSQRCVLVLAASQFDCRQVLLGSLSEEEALPVLERKAANGIGAGPGEALFWAQRFMSPVEGAEASQDTWLVHTRLRSTHFELLIGLRSAGIRIQRIVAGREVLTHMLDHVEGDHGQVLVTTTGQAVYAQLFRGNKLVQESRLHLNFETRSDTYALVIQDVRQLAAFWAKGSRGTALDAVHLFGFAEEEIESISVPLGIASQGARIENLGSAPSSKYEDLRGQLLRIFMVHHGKARDLRVPLPARRSRIAAVMVAITLATAASVWRWVDDWSSRIQERRSEINGLITETQAIDGAERVRSAYRAARRQLTDSVESIHAIGELGVPLGAALQHMERTFGQVADLRHLTLRDEEGATRVIVEGTLPYELEDAAARLERLRRKAQLDPRLTEIEISPETRVPDREQDESLRFSFRGLYQKEGA